MTVLVWVDAWQMQCCGEPFAVGDTVSWTLDDAPDVRWLAAALGPDVAGRIAYAEDHHGELPEDHPVRRGAVVAIQAAYGRSAPVGDDRTLRPVPGSGVLRATDVADGDEPTASDERFIGYVVELDLGTGVVRSVRRR